MNEPPPDSRRDAVGTALGGDRYAVTGVLGEGSQGATLEAIDKKDGTLVAIKRFRIRGSRSWKEVELAEREAKVLGRLEHPQLPKLLDHFEEGGALYLVMERIAGETLAATARLGRSDVIRFLHDADRVLAYLHGQTPPIIHRDIKPSNVIRRPTDRGPHTHVLVDFGSVRDSFKPAGGSTVVGTFGYMAPEQFQGRALPQSDVYAVGATALRMLTGVEPEALPHKGLAIDVGAALPNDPDLAQVLARLLEPDPDRRPARIAPLLAALATAAPPARRAAPEHEREVDGAAAAAPALSKRERKRERKRQKKRDKELEKARGRREREARRRRAAERAGEGVPPFVLPFVLFGLSVARIAVNVTLRAVVPAVLVALSVVFGEGLRRAARAVREAGAVSDRALARATRHVMGRRADEAPPVGPRIEASAGDASSPPRGTEPQRVAPELSRGVIDDVEEALEEVAEEVAEELEAFAARRKERRKRR